MQSWRKPTDQQVEAAVRTLVKPGYLRYFFDKLENPEWIEPLWRRGFFATAPSPVRNEETNSVSLPLWVESRYLARMATHVPELVAQVIESIPYTENSQIIEDFVDAALSMPPSVAAKLAVRATEWTKCP